jgi:metallo-beta-lactamase family protein
MLVSYQAPGTLGSRLLEQRPTIHFHGRNWNFWADVVDVHGLSGHADQLDLLALLPDRAQRVALVHGEVAQAEALASALRERGPTEVVIPGPGESIGLR